MSPTEYIDFTIGEGFGGIEINIPNDDVFETGFHVALQEIRKTNSNFILCLQQVPGIQNETPQEHLEKVLIRLEGLVRYQPDFINSHTGKDHFSFEENCIIIEAIEEFSVRSSIPVYHEIHRGRFTFHSRGTLRYFDFFPELKLVGDFSHWFVVSESLLHDQEETILATIPHIAHLHARVSTEQASQVNNPFAPEWAGHLERFTNIWDAVLRCQKNPDQLTITPEYGPFPYMPQTPFTKEPLSNQRELNIKMKDYLKMHLE